MKSRILLKRIISGFAIILLIAFLIFAFRYQLLRIAGNMLIQEDELEQAEALFLLSGNLQARADEAERLYKSAYVPAIICTGEVVPELLKAVGIFINEAALSRKKLIEKGIPESKVTLLAIGTSTREEGNAILRYCQSNHLKKIMIVSDKFHTNRVNYTFRDKFEDAGIELILRGAPAIAYNENCWWANEAGLLMVNNEYVKLFYYYINY